MTWFIGNFLKETLGYAAPNMDRYGTNIYHHEHHTMGM